MARSEAEWKSLMHHPSTRAMFNRYEFELDPLIPAETPHPTTDKDTDQ